MESPHERELQARWLFDRYFDIAKALAPIAYREDTLIHDQQDTQRGLQMRLQSLGFLIGLTSERNGNIDISGRKLFVLTYVLVEKGCKDRVIASRSIGYVLPSASINILAEKYAALAKKSTPLVEGGRVTDIEHETLLRNIGISDPL